MKRRLAWCLLVAAVTLLAPAARAQVLSPTQPGSVSGGKSETPTGPAEAAPEGAGEEPELPALPPWPGQETKKLKLFEMKGYFRFRADMFHNANLGMPTEGSYQAPFYRPISEGSTAFNCDARSKKSVPGGSDRDLDSDDCPAETLAGANIRLRLEPTINVSEQVRIHAQLDIFDNLVLGSTPNGLADGGRSPQVPLIAFSDTQAPPVAGRNTRTPAILVKRAWAEVGTPFGQLRAGRMPSQWGLGLLANDGSCWDCDYGDNADRIMFVTKLAGHIFGMGYDFAASGPSSLSVNDGRMYFDGQAIDLEQLDDVDQLIWVAGRIDNEEVIKDKVDRGDVVVNYGVYLVWRKQDFDYQSGSYSTWLSSTESSFATNMVERHAWALIPDLWFKLLWKKLFLEWEGVLIGGVIENSSDEDKEDSLDILQFGWALKAHYKFLKDSLFVGLDLGMASGDQAENYDLNRRRILTMQDPDVGDYSLNEFRFDYDYHVDLILFREIMGTVANAFYLKPWIQYLLADTFGARLDMIYSAALEPVAYPGNDPNLGVELDLDIFYRNKEEGFFAGVQYGVLFPLDGLDRPADIPDFGTTYSHDAEVAHTLQGRLVVQF